MLILTGFLLVILKFATYTQKGSLFELLGGSPILGFIPTAAIALVGLPLCLFLFYAAILKAKAETEEDDKDFLKK